MWNWQCTQFVHTHSHSAGMHKITSNASNSIRCSAMLFCYLAHRFNGPIDTCSCENFNPTKFLPAWKQPNESVLTHFEFLQANFYAFFPETKEFDSAFLTLVIYTASAIVIAHLQHHRILWSMRKRYEQVVAFMLASISGFWIFSFGLLRKT